MENRSGNVGYRAVEGQVDGFGHPSIDKRREPGLSADVINLR
jgi:hypothetical protein